MILFSNLWIEKCEQIPSILVFNISEINDSINTLASDKLIIDNIFSKIMEANISLFSCSRISKIVAHQVNHVQ